MPEEGVCKKTHEEMLTEDEQVTAIEAAATLGITKVRITGGEPLVKKNILSICRRISKIPEIKEVCLTTNGIGLETMAVPLKEAGVNHLNISLDTLDEEKYGYITRVGKLKEALQGIETAFEAGFDIIKINAVLIGGFNDNEIRNLAELTCKYPMDVRFIELMPMPNSSDFGPEAYLSGEEVLKALPEATPVSFDGGTAKLYRLPGAKGRIGLIRPLSSNFCEICNRIRITADGKVKPCLHSDEEFNLKGCDKEEMTAILKEAIWRKPQWHGELSYEQKSHTHRSMNQIGG